MVQVKADNPGGSGDASVDLVTWSCSVPGILLQGVSNIEGAAIYGLWASCRSGVAGHVLNDTDCWLWPFRSCTRLSMMPPTRPA